MEDECSSSAYCFSPAEERNGKESAVLCGAEWVTFNLPGLTAEQRDEMQSAVANRPVDTVLTIRKADVRNLVYYSDTKGGEIVFALQTGSKERPTVFYSGLVSERVYLDVMACLN